MNTAEFAKAIAATPHNGTTCCPAHRIEGHIATLDARIARSNEILEMVRKHG